MAAARMITASTGRRPSELQIATDDPLGRQQTDQTTTNKARSGRQLICHCHRARVEGSHRDELQRDEAKLATRQKYELAAP
jgi:hypothetical protein